MMKLFSRLMLVLALGVTSPAYASQDGEVTLKLIMGHRTKRILRIERKEYQTY